MLYIGCLLIRELRATSKVDRARADSVVKMLNPHVEGLRNKMLKELKSELLEVRGDRVKPVKGSEQGVEDGGEKRLEIVERGE